MGSRQLTEAVVFGTSTIAETWNEAEPLFYHHAAEVGPLPFRRFKPDREFYDGLERAGVLDVFTMRVEGKLAGYSLFTTIRQPDFGDALWCRESCIYVEKKWRGPKSIEFQTFQDRYLRAKYTGAEVIRYSAMKHDRSRTLMALGYRQGETAWILDRQEEVTLG